MKKAKILSVALATLVAASLAATTAFSSYAATLSAGETGKTITISDNKEGYTYQAFQVFAGKIADGSTLTDIIWGDGVNTSAANFAADVKAALGITDDSFDVTNAAAVAKELSKYADDSAQALAFAEVIGKNLTSVTTGTYENNSITGLPAGYYLINNASVPATDGSYTNFILKVTKNNASVTPKRDTPKVDKKVVEGDYTSPDAEKNAWGDKYNDIADYDIGEAINFELVGTLPTNYKSYETYSYTFKDYYSEGITPSIDSIKVYVETDGDLKEINATALVKDTDYTVTEDTTNRTFSIVIDDLKDELPNESYTENTKIVVRYTGVLNEKAKIGLPGNPNEVDLTYSNNPNGEGEGTTPKDKVIVFTYEVDVDKYDGADNTKLDGVTFKLFNSDMTKVAEVAEGKFVKWLDVVKDENNVVTNGTELVTANGGVINVAGVQDGTYKLVEVATLAGYNKIENPIEFTITATTANGQTWTGTATDALTELAATDAVADNVVAEDGTGRDNVTVSVENNKGSILPSTGGIGTTIFYVCGGIIVAAAAVLLIVKMRKREA